MLKWPPKIQLWANGNNKSRQRVKCYAWSPESRVKSNSWWTNVDIHWPSDFFRSFIRRMFVLLSNISLLSPVLFSFRKSLWLLTFFWFFGHTKENQTREKKLHWKWAFELVLGKAYSCLISMRCNNVYFFCCCCCCWFSLVSRWSLWVEFLKCKRIERNSNGFFVLKNDCKAPIYICHHVNLFLCLPLIFCVPFFLHFVPLLRRSSLLTIYFFRVYLRSASS